MVSTASLLMDVVPLLIECENSYLLLNARTVLKFVICNATKCNQVPHIAALSRQ